MDQTPPIPPPPASSLFDMELDAVGQNHLNTISKWGKFISITLLVIMLITGGLLAAFYQEIVTWLRNDLNYDEEIANGVLVVLIVFLIIGLVPLFFLLRAATLIRRGLVTQDGDRLADGFRSLKIVFTISAIISILFLLLSIISLVTN
jgi:hypothetical protein